MRPTPAPAPRRVTALSELALAIFRAHGALIARGDALVAPFGLTSARWQVLGALALAGGSLTVPDIARSMGVSRQGIQKQVDLLQGEGLVTKAPNPGHERSQLVELTGPGKSAFARADRRWSELATTLGAGLPISALSDTAALLDELTQRLTASGKDEG